MLKWHLKRSQDKQSPTTEVEEQNEINKDEASDTKKRAGVPCFRKNSTFAEPKIFWWDLECCRFERGTNKQGIINKYKSRAITTHTDILTLGTQMLFCVQYSTSLWLPNVSQLNHMPLIQNMSVFLQLLVFTCLLSCEKATGISVSSKACHTVTNNWLLLTLKSTRISRHQFMRIGNFLVGHWQGTN